ncbi:insulinase family protein [Marispirochaeta sp.]|uniref:M16 family metallopeptidase n=1 Tax=Marispirochaeta sp. TaxID=2038653 RepID=UPI0029C61F41|nr:insulinase family protein [Marispirochaeta sp.]
MKFFNIIPRTLPALLLILIFSGCAGLSSVQESPLPIDPKLIRGELDNGLRYFIRENREPQNRISLRLFVNAGSVLEEEDQRGVAHLLEHMAFKGSTHFDEGELEGFLESLGMRFGPDLNAYTSFDETVYQLELPADDPEAIEKGFLVLQDWAGGIRIDPEALDRERLVVREEWRLRRGAQTRIRDAQISKLLEGSRYAERLPIGDMEVVMNIPAEGVREFYQSWYRPDLMGIAVVGDISTEKAEELIREYFSGPAKDTRDTGRPRFSVPLSQKNEALVLADPELTIGKVEVMTKLPPSPLASLEDYREEIREILFWNMLNSRLEERTKEANPPFMRAGGSNYTYVREVDLSYLTGRGKPEAILTSLEELLKEVRRIELHGFTASELQRESARVMKSVENAWKEQENRESSSIIREIGEYYLKNVGMPGIDFEYELFKEELPRISLEEINSLFYRFFPEKGRLITLSLPEADSLPSQEDVLRVLQQVSEQDLPPYREEIIGESLIAELPPAGKIAGIDNLETADTSVLRLSNGMRIVLKPTDFQKNRVLLTGFSPGGESLVPSEELPAARTAVTIREESGLGDFTATELARFLADKDVSVKSYIGRYYEGFSGESSTGDLEYLFQLIHAGFTVPRFDDSAFDSVRERLTASLANRDKSPQTLFSDTLNRLLSNGSPRREPFTVEIIAEMDLELSERIYRERFSDPGDFTLVLVGDFDTDEAADFAKRYLAALPGTGKKESWKDNGVRPVETPAYETVRRGIEDQSTAAMIFTLPMAWSREEALKAQAAASVLENILREKIREELGGTYSVSAWANLNQRPYEHVEGGVYFGADPEQVSDLSKEVLNICRGIAKSGPEERYIRNEIEAFRRDHETRLRENSFWLNHLERSFRDGDDPEDLLTPEEYAELINAGELRTKIDAIFREENLIQVILLPET